MNTAFHHLPEFDKHDLILPLKEERAGLDGFIVIHRGEGRKAFGATRLWQYASSDEALRDALRLSKLMSYKCALAGFSFGGAKAVLVRKPMNRLARQLLLKTYARKVHELGGQFITGADMGLSQNDLLIMKQETPFMVGARVNPARYTGLGIFYAIQVCLKEVFGAESIEGKTFAIEGLGKIGKSLLHYLYKKAKRIYVTDINETIVKKIKRKFPDITAVSPKEIPGLSVDVYSPCAYGNAVNAETVTRLCCKIVAGGANSQLESDALGDRLFSSGIVYAPDYVANAGGLMSVVSEFENEEQPQKIKRKVATIKDTLRKIFDGSARQHRPPHRIAHQMAEAIIAPYG